MGLRSTFLFFAANILLVALLTGQTPGCGDDFFDSGGADGNYSVSESLEWTICPDNSGDVVTIDFTFVSIESGWDFLSVYSGSDLSNLLDGNVLEPASFTSFADDGCLTVTFTSDGSVTLEGWAATISCGPPPTCPDPSNLFVGDVTAEGATFSWDQEGNITVWDLEIVLAGEAPTGTPTLTGVTNSPFIWDGGDSGTSYEVYLRGHCPEDGEFTAWIGPVAFTTNPACGDNFFDSGGADGNYMNNDFLQQTICPDMPGDVVTIDFTFVDIESGWDFLGVYSGSDLSNPLDENILAPASFTSFAEDGCLTVTFDSDGSVSLGGWEATITCGPAATCPDPINLLVTDMNGAGATFSWDQFGTVTMWDVEIVLAGEAPTGVPTVTDIDTNPYTWADGVSGTNYEIYLRGQCEEAGEFTAWVGPVAFMTNLACGDNFFDSGGPDGDYMNNDFFESTICPDVMGDVVTVEFTVVDIESGFDFLAVYSGSDLSSPLNENILEPASFTSASEDGCLTITFDSDGSVAFPGWEAIISCGPPPECAAPSNLAVSDITGSGATFSWDQIGGVSAWDVEFVLAGEAPTGTPTVMGITDNPYTWTGGETGTAYEVYLRGQCPTAGEFTEWVGPVAFTTIPGCGDNYFDPGGPDGNYMNNELLEQTFCPDNPGDVVTINFTFVNIESGFDFLAIYSGSDLSNQLADNVLEPASFTSIAEDGCLTVTFDSDGSVTRPGWEATITCGDPPPCPNPTDVVVTDPTATGATIAWSQAGDVALWQFEIVPVGTDPTGMPSITGVVDNPFVWDGGEAGTAYDVYIQGVCPNDEGLTNWVGPVTFVTLPACGGQFFDSGGPNDTYENSELNQWVFCPDDEGDVVTLVFLSVDVEGCCDVLSVYNGAGDDEILEFDIEDPITLTSTAEDGCLTVTWDSDGSVTLDGWVAQIICDVPPDCENPADIELTGVSNVGGSFAWTQEGAISAWDVEIVPTGEMPTGVPTAAGIDVTEYTWTGGESGTTYDFYVRGQCDDGGFSYWIGPLTFTTVPGCGQPFFDLGGPDGNYVDNADETYIFCPDEPGDFVTIDFTLVEIDGFGDELSVFNGTGTDDPIQIGVFEPTSFYSNAVDGCLTVTFQSSGFFNDPGWEAFIGCEPCVPSFQELGIVVSEFDHVSATIDLGTELSNLIYEVEFDTLGFMPGTGNTFMGSASSFMLENLEENTTYEFYVTSFCADDPDFTTVFGPYEFTTIYGIDVGITQLIEPSEECGFGFGESIQVGITNFGALPQTFIPLNFSVNGEPSGVSQPTDGLFTGVISRDSTEIFEFDVPYDFTDIGSYTIQIWTELEDDSDFLNDTLTLVIERFAPPFYEDFETGEIADNLTVSDAQVFDPAAHNNETFVLGVNLWANGPPVSSVTLPVMGPMAADDALFFDYRFVNWSAGDVPTIIGPDDVLNVLVSGDCGITYDTLLVITEGNHEPAVDFSTREVALGQYAGQSIQIVIEMTYGSGDYWFDLDNINLPSCANLAADISITDANDGMNDGGVTLVGTGGVAPYTFAWSDGMDGDVRTELPAGEYLVTMSDAVGCEREFIVFVDNLVGTTTIPEVIGAIQLAPNPTRNQAQLQVDFVRPVSTQVDIVNLLGQVVWQSERQLNANRLVENLDLSQVPNGVYLVRVHADNQSVIRRLIKTN